MLTTSPRRPVRRTLLPDRDMGEARWKVQRVARAHRHRHQQFRKPIAVAATSFAACTLFSRIQFVLFARGMAFLSVRAPFGSSGRVDPCHLLGRAASGRVFRPCCSRPPTSSARNARSSGSNQLQPFDDGGDNGDRGKSEGPVQHREQENPLVRDASNRRDAVNRLLLPSVEELQEMPMIEQAFWQEVIYERDSEVANYERPVFTDGLESTVMELSTRATSVDEDHWVNQTMLELPRDVAVSVLAPASTTGKPIAVLERIDPAGAESRVLGNRSESKLGA